MSKGENKHTGAVVDSGTGEMLTTAIGPVERLEWLEQVLRDSDIEHAAKALAIALQAFVNRRDGYAFPGVERLGQAANMAPRTAKRHLASLQRRGHVFIGRRRRTQAAIFLVIQDGPESGLSNAMQEVPVSGTSKQSQEVPEAGTSYELRSAALRHQEVPLYDIKKGHGQKNIEAKSNTCGPITQRLNQETEPSALGREAARQAPAVATASGVDNEGKTSPYDSAREDADRISATSLARSVASDDGDSPPEWARLEGMDADDPEKDGLLAYCDLWHWHGFRRPYDPTLGNAYPRIQRKLRDSKRRARGAK